MSKWETIVQTQDDDRTERLKVPGGWLVCRISGRHLPHEMAGWFVSDPEYAWNPDNTFYDT